MDQLLTSAAEVFGAGRSREPPVEVKTLLAKMGELALESDFENVRSARPAC
ncbi:MAG: hypothetical protein IT361_11350 [Gemmatimonadaceae bacterium]|nr:hypothetical protein [Gemmatimonadaceae bacterium]